MSRIKSKNTKPEIMARKYLFSKGFRYRKNVTNLPGKPDIVLGKYKSVIFVNGCFWHKHEGCKCFTVPKTRTDWWMEKIEKNVLKDKENYEKLIQQGWRVYVIWECQIERELQKSMDRIISEIKE